MDKNKKTQNGVENHQAKLKASWRDGHIRNKGAQGLLRSDKEEHG
jgi:hypothetical protein